MRAGNSRSSSMGWGDRGASGRLKTAKGEGAKATAPSGEVTLKIEGSPGTEFSGTCIIGGEGEEAQRKSPQALHLRTRRAAPRM